MAPLPGAPPEYAGVTLVRGEPVGVLDVGLALTGRSSFALEAGTPSRSSVLIVLDSKGGLRYALLAERVDGVEVIEDAAIEAPPQDSPRLSGLVAEGSRFLALLSIERLVANPASSRDTARIPPAGESNP